MKNTTTQTRVAAAPKTASTVFSIVAAGMIGLALMAVAGHVQASTLHDAAHDVRHATGFPCH